MYVLFLVECMFLGKFCHRAKAQLQISKYKKNARNTEQLLKNKASEIDANFEYSENRKFLEFTMFFL
jgi:hypothetical protein